MTAAFLLYGATGYTGGLIARKAVERGLRPILAGRSRAKLAPIAAALGVDYRVAALDEPASLDQALADQPLVLNCAGPFGQSGGPLVEACLRTGAHYLDLAGEFPEFEALAAQGQRAAAAGVMLMPGVGFGVVPTDCLAAYLHQRLPDARRLSLAFQTVGGVSQGTAQTLFKDIMSPGVVRRGGRLVPSRPAEQRRKIDFGQGPVTAVTNPWRGDLVTAFHTTAIPDIETFTAFPAPVPQLMAANGWAGGLWRNKQFQQYLDGLIARLPAGPSDEALAGGRTAIWGEAVSASGQRVAARLYGPEAYLFTALTALAVVAEVLAGKTAAGFRTPAGVYGADFVLSIPGVRRDEPPLQAGPRGRS
jgi:short subunit dehydrogenase-like uncharacterized protein